MNMPETVRLKDVVDYQTGFPFKSQQYTISGTRLLRGDNIGQGSLRWDGAKFWPDIASSEITNFILRKGDVVLAMDRPWIEAGLKYASVTESDLPTLLVQRVARLRETERIDGGFLRYLIGSAEFTEHILNITTGTAVPHISGKDILSFEFDLPSIARQREIAAVLGALDDKIELNRKTAAVLEEMARALYRSWFVDFDPVWAKTEGRPPAHMDASTSALFPDKFGDDGLPMGWHDVMLKKIAEVEIGGLWGNDNPENVDEVPYKCLRGVDLQHLRESGAALKTPIRYGKLSKINRRKIGSSDVLIASSGAGPCGRPLWVGIDGFMEMNTPTIYSNFVKRLRCATPSHACFVDATLYEMRISGEIQNYISGTSIPNLNDGGLMNGKNVVLAPEPVLAAFYERVLAMQRKHYSGENQTLAALRDSLLPRLMSGELRIGAAREMLAEVA